MKPSIANRQAKIVNAFEWLTRPGSQQLGAKWVEVTKPAGTRRLIGG